MKIRALLIALLLFAPLLPAYAATPPKAGAICSKAGITKNYNGKKYTCIKSGKKLVWNKGVVIKVVTQAPAPTVTITATPSPAPTGTITATPQPSATPTPVLTTSPTPSPTEIVEDSGVTPTFENAGGDGWKLKLLTSTSLQFTFWAKDFRSYKAEAFPNKDMAAIPVFRTGVIKSRLYKTDVRIENLLCDKSNFYLIRVTIYSKSDGTGKFMEGLWTIPLTSSCVESINLQSVEMQTRPSIRNSNSEACKLLDARKTKIQRNNVGFPLLLDLLPSQGIMKLAFVPIDFSDSVGDTNSMNIMNDQIQKLKQWYQDYSAGKLKVESRSSNTWFRAPKPSSEYKTGKNLPYVSAGGFNDQWKAYIQEFIDSTGNEMNFEGVQGILFFFPVKNNLQITEAIQLRGETFRTNQGNIKLYVDAPGRYIYGGLSILDEPFSRLYGYWIHELLHSQGISLHAPHNSGQISVSNQFGDSFALDAWETFLLDWFDEEQIFCSPLKVGDQAIALLEPIDIPGRGTRIAIVPLTNTTALVVEARRNAGYSKDWPNTSFGSFVYLVDTTKDNDRSAECCGDWGNEQTWSKWAYLLIPEGRTSFRTDVDLPSMDLYQRYLLRSGDRVLFDGVEIKSLEIGKFDAIQMRRIGESIGTPVGNATGVIRPKEIDKVVSLTDLGEGERSTSYWAWKSASSRAAGPDQKLSSDRDIDTKIELGPQTTLDLSNLETSILRSSRMWKSFRQPLRVVFIYFTFLDLSWAKERLKVLTGSTKDRELDSLCSGETLCSNSKLFIGVNGEALIATSVPNNSGSTNSLVVGANEAREFNRAIQRANMLDSDTLATSGCCIFENGPTWFLEGLLEFSSLVSLNLNSYKDYFSKRQLVVDDLKTKKLTIQQIQDLLQSTDTEVTRNYSIELQRQIGLIAVEILSAFKSHEIVFQVLKMKNASRATNDPYFEAGFNNKVKIGPEDPGTYPFGLDWEKAKYNLAQAIYKLLNN